MSAPVTSPIRVLVLDDHPIVRAGLRMLINGHPGLTVVGETGDCAEAVAIAAREQPDVIILDLDLGRSSGLDTLPQLLASAPRARVLVLTGVYDREAHARAVELGASGVVRKDEAREIFIQAIEKVHAGEAWLDGDTMGRALDHLRHPRDEVPQTDPDAARISSLTKREQQIIALVCQGYKNQQVADQLSISEGTVRNHLTVIYEKLGVSDRFGLIVFAAQHNL
ncbi:MAG: response regulator [Blastocatellia bacterium]